MRGRTTAAVAAIVLAAAGCGGSAPSPKLTRPGLSASQSQGLLTRLATVRAAAAGGDLKLTELRLRGFTREVARLRAASAIDAATARALATGAARAAIQAAAEVVAKPKPAPATPTAPQPSPAKPGKHGDKKHGKGHGKGEGD